MATERQDGRARFPQIQNSITWKALTANKIWNSLLRGDNDGNAVVPINPDGIEMTGGWGRSGGGRSCNHGWASIFARVKNRLNNIDENAEVVIPKRLIGNDMADKLSARLRHYARLLIDTAQAENYNLLKY